MAVAMQNDYAQHVSDYRYFLRVLRYVIAFLAVLLLMLSYTLV